MSCPQCTHGHALPAQTKPPRDEAEDIFAARKDKPEFVDYEFVDYEFVDYEFVDYEFVDYKTATLPMVDPVKATFVKVTIVAFNGFSGQKVDDFDRKASSGQSGLRDDNGGVL
ncbi:hypothetical protein PHLGIDRAFT_17062, partial [Phlebiopsis gigantea 11061_1 CR5-6]